MRDRHHDRYRRSIEAHTGIKLGPDEVVHHADEDKTNDTPINLVVKTRSVHTREHNQARGLSKLRASLRMAKEGKKIY